MLQCFTWTVVHGPEFSEHDSMRGDIAGAGYGLAAELYARERSSHDGVVGV